MVSEQVRHDSCAGSGLEIFYPLRHPAVSHDPRPAPRHRSLVDLIRIAGQLRDVAAPIYPDQMLPVGTPRGIRDGAVRRDAEKWPLVSLDPIHIVDDRRL